MQKQDESFVINEQFLHTSHAELVWSIPVLFSIRLHRDFYSTGLTRPALVGRSELTHRDLKKKIIKTHICLTADLISLIIFLANQ